MLLRFPPYCSHIILISQHPIWGFGNEKQMLDSSTLAIIVTFKNSFAGLSPAGTGKMSSTWRKYTQLAAALGTDKSSTLSQVSVLELSAIF